MKNTMNMNKLEKVSGGYYLGSDKYTKEEYAQVGITWEHNFWTRDRYFLNGKEISQSDAEWYTTLHLHDYTVIDNTTGDPFNRKSLPCTAD